MRILSVMAVMVAMLLLTVLPAAADSLGSGAPTPEPTTEPGGSEEPSEEPTTEPGGSEEPTPISEREELASTGIDTPTMALIGGGLLLAGGAALVVTRSGRRKDA